MTKAHVRRHPIRAKDLSAQGPRVHLLNQAHMAEFGKTAKIWHWEGFQEPGKGKCKAQKCFVNPREMG